MSPVAINENTIIKEIRPKYTLEQRTIKKNKNQSVFIPLNQLPEELTAKISENTIVFTLNYSISEDVRETALNSTITVWVGVNTGRLFKLAAIFQENNISDLLATFDEVKKSIEDLKAVVPREILKKNYELISMLTEMIKKAIVARKDDVENYFADSKSDNLKAA